jgi:hypothetical protein
MKRTSRTAIVLRLTAVGWIFFILPAFLTGFINMRELWVYAIIMFVFFYGFFGAIAVAAWLVAVVVLHDDEDTQELLRRGFRPFWDTVPWPINPDPPVVRCGFEPEPQYGEFGTPPPDWTVKCYACGARNHPTYATCWWCSSGLGNPLAVAGRLVTCWNCNGQFQEAAFGDLERGVACPHCRAQNVAAK